MNTITLVYPLHEIVLVIEDAEPHFTILTESLKKDESVKEIWTSGCGGPSHKLWERE